MNAISYSINDIPETVTTKIIKSFIGILKKRTSFDVQSVYVIGSSVSKLVVGQCKFEKDIDIAIFVNEEISRGKQILSDDEFEKILAALERMYKIRVGLNYNGIPRFLAGQIILDPIPARVSDAYLCFPQVVIDMCNRDNIYLEGKSILSSLMNFPLNPEIVVERIEVTNNYLEREVENLAIGGNLCNYIAKCVIFALEMASNFAIDRNLGDDILLSLIQSDGSKIELKRLASQALDICPSDDPREIISVFRNFSNKLITILQVEGFLMQKEK